MSRQAKRWLVERGPLFLPLRNEGEREGRLSQCNDIPPTSTARPPSCGGGYQPEPVAVAARSLGIADRVRTGMIRRRAIQNTQLFFSATFEAGKIGGFVGQMPFALAVPQCFGQTFEHDLLGRVGIAGAF